MVVRRTIARRIPPTDSGVSPSNTPNTRSYELRRDQKCVLYSKASYEAALESFLSFLDDSKLGVVYANQLLCGYFVTAEQPVPECCLFNAADTFRKVLARVRDGNEARVLRDTFNCTLCGNACLLWYNGSRMLG